MERFKLGIIIPVYNEQKTIRNIVKKSIKYGDVIIVNDGSTDNSIKEIQDLKIKIIKNDFNLGYERSLEKGFQFALKNNFDYIITIDADGQHDVRCIQLIIEDFKKGFDLVVGNRNKKNRLSEKIFSFYSKLIYNISDPCCGLKGYSMKLYAQQGFFSNFNSIGTQLTFFAKKKNYNISEFNLNVSNREDESRFGNILYANYKIFTAIIITFFKSLNENFK